MDCRRTEPRDHEAARRVLTQARRGPGLPETLPRDGSAAQAAAGKSDHEEQGTASVSGPGQDRQKRVEPAPSAVKRSPRPRASVELRPLRQQRQRRVEAGDEGRPAAARCSSLAASSPPQPGRPAPVRPPEPNLRQNP
jgi:hypothetical protein